MPRPPRVQDPDLIYHVGSRAVDKQQIFEGRLPKDDAHFVDLLAGVVRDFRLRLYAYCVIWNHFHLVVQAPDANLSEAMQMLKSEYACWFNYLDGREGALWERRFWDTTARDEGGPAEHIRYVVLNPVRADRVRHPDQWEASSYRATVGLVDAPAFLDVEGALELVGGDGATAARFAEFVNEGLPSHVQGGLVGV